MQNPIFSVSEFNEMLNFHLAQLGEVVVEGEISRIDVSRGQWLFITIKDEYAAVDVFGVAFQLSGWRALEEGMKVHVYGVASIHQRSGKFSIRAERIVPAGEGAMKIAFERLRSQLEKEGIFDISRKRETPRFPQHIGLVTAKGSQAYNDFIKVLKHRMGGMHIYFSAVSVQGVDAVDAICAALVELNKRDLDVIIVCRGGGSMEDLAAFNDEKVVRAIFASRAPVMTGVGHEGDVTLADMVADVRASTPSNAAELLVQERAALIQEVDSYCEQLYRTICQQIIKKSHHVEYAQTILAHKLQQTIIHMHQTIELFLKISNSMYRQKIREKMGNIEQLERLLTSFDPAHVLKRGFTITRNELGQLVRSISSAGSQLQTIVTDGTIYSHVHHTKKN
ncbi:exodeoxyribonuclease VII large subunit [Candidatus Roizmanbacteria bacterium RIFCSPLOWO2_01_FULL_42_14]|uniref:Exodeoxyribonuclease 7 large subunit n=2 Tax=Candidatus Roizmaniibacteriota TaxID=1752723 RepID=A0A1F7J9Y3_9BACT|nr:MAG: exodeoxyribonuclease VII large subunit [Candidatus Roizmanbacteria bacterium RIFCSPLOWO2_01_FULL_42_14]